MAEPGLRLGHLRVGGGGWILGMRRCWHDILRLCHDKALRLLCLDRDGSWRHVCLGSICCLRRCCACGILLLS